MNQLEKDKMQERIDWSFNFLKEKIKNEGLKVSDEVLFSQSAEMGRCLFVRSEIAFSSKKQ